MGIRKEGLYCGACCNKTASVQKIKEESDINIFAVVCPVCDSKGYHAGYATKRTKEQNDALAQDKAAQMWLHVNGEG